MPKKSKRTKIAKSNHLLLIVLVISTLSSTILYAFSIFPNLNIFSNKNNIVDVNIVATDYDPKAPTAKLIMSATNSSVNVDEPIEVSVSLDDLDEGLSHRKIIAVNFSLLVPKPLVIDEQSITSKLSDYFVYSLNIEETNENYEIGVVAFINNPENGFLGENFAEVGDILKFKVSSPSAIGRDSINFKTNSRSPKILAYIGEGLSGIDILNRDQLKSLYLSVKSVNFDGFRIEYPKKGKLYYVGYYPFLSVKFNEGSQTPGKVEVSVVGSQKPPLVSTSNLFQGHLFPELFKGKGEYTILAKAFAKKEDTQPVMVTNTKIVLTDGDLNSDGKGDSKDLLVIIDWLFSDDKFNGPYDINGDGKVFKYETVDINSDGEVDVQDVVLLAQYFYYDHPLPPPVPAF